MNRKLVKTEYNFPKDRFKAKDELADSIIRMMENSGSMDFSGYADPKTLRKNLLDHIGDGNVKQYDPEIYSKNKGKLEDIILEAAQKFDVKLPLPAKNYIFVNPYITAETDSVFEGVMAQAPYSCVVHLFVNIFEYSKKSLENTIAHELNHTVYYYYHFDDFNDYTLLDEIVIEGLAENFREQFFDPKITKWAGALSKQEALTILKESQDILLSRDKKLIKDFLFGNDKYSKWTGYSVGYWLVKEYLHSHKDLSWEKIMKIRPKELLKTITQQK